LLGPSEFSIHSFPAEIKILAINELDRLLEKHNNFLNQQTKDFIISTKQSLLDCLHEYNQASINEFKKYIKKSDIEMIKQNSIKFAKDGPLFITTSKDRVRIEPLLLEDEKSFWIEIPLTIEIDEAEKFNEIIENYVRSN